MNVVNVKCSMKNCENSSENGKCFFPFPRDFVRCMLWVQNCGKPDFFQDFAYAGAQPFLNRYVCSDHFLEGDFQNILDISLGILDTAIPYQKYLDAKQDPLDNVYGEQLSATIEGSIISQDELINNIKEEPFEEPSRFSFSSTDDSSNDFYYSDNTVNGSTDGNVNDEEEKLRSDEFFRRYRKALRTSQTKHNETEDPKEIWFYKNAVRRPSETEIEKQMRLKRNALRVAVKRSQESYEQKTERRMKNALRAAFRRRNESPEQREMRLKKDVIRTQKRRKAETEQESSIRRYNDAVRAAFRRNNETEQQKIERKIKDIQRVAKRRSLETPEQREERLRKDRERANKRRMIRRITEQMGQFKGAIQGVLSPVETGVAEVGDNSFALDNKMLDMQT